MSGLGMDIKIVWVRVAAPKQLRFECPVALII